MWIETFLVEQQTFHNTFIRGKAKNCSFHDITDLDVSLGQKITVLLAGALQQIMAPAPHFYYKILEGPKCTSFYHFQNCLTGIDS